MAEAEASHPISRPGPAGRTRAAQAWDLLWVLVRRDLKARYAGSALGGLWNLIHPVVMILVYMVVFSALITNRIAGGSPRDYAVHLCSGMLVWLVFAETVSRSAAVLIDNAHFLRKVSFPPLVLFASVLINVLLVYGFGFGVFYALLAATGSAPPGLAAAALVLMAWLGVGAAGMGMIVAALHVFFRDTAQIVAVALQIGFWLNPIVYPKSLVEDSALGRWSAWLAWNPVERFISTAQRLMGSPEASAWPLAGPILVLFPLICLSLGLIVFHRLLPDIRDGI